MTGQIFQDSTVMPLFPSLVWSHDLKPEVAGALNDSLLGAIDRVLAPRPAIKPGQNWQTHHDLHKRGEFAELLGYIRTAAKGVLDFLQVDYEDFQVTGCWANVNPQGSPHATHSHPNNYLGGVYYLRAGVGGDTISFHDPRPQTNIITPNVRQRNNHNTSPINIPVKPGRLLVFPAWLRHSVLPNTSDGERVSISFNVMFSAYAETMSPPKWQGIGGLDAGR